LGKEGSIDASFIVDQLVDPGRYRAMYIMHSWVLVTLVGSVGMYRPSNECKCKWC
jgi:hypothetical protein